MAIVEKQIHSDEYLVEELKKLGVFVTIGLAKYYGQTPYGYYTDYLKKYYDVTEEQIGRVWFLFSQWLIDTLFDYHYLASKKKRG